MNQDKKRTIFTIKNSKEQMDLLRIHVYEQSIRFDKKIDEAIKKYPELSEEVEELNDLWKNQQITEKQIIYAILHLMGKYGAYLQKFYFKKEELDENGCFVDKSLMLNLNSISEPEDDKEFFYLYFKEQNSLKKISKKTFEGELPEKFREEYVEKYVYKGARFYSGFLDEQKVNSTWYFMIVQDSIIMGFEKINQ